VMVAGAPIPLTGEGVPAMALIGLDPTVGVVSHWRQHEIPQRENQEAILSAMSTNILQLRSIKT